MRLKIAGITSIVCAFAVGIGLYFVVGYVSIIAGVAILYGVFLALGALALRLPWRRQAKSGQPLPTAGRVRGPFGDGGTFQALTCLSFIIGIALGIGANFLLGESSIIICFGGWAFVQFVAMFLVMVFGKPAVTEDTRVSQEEDAQVSQEGNGARADAVFGKPAVTEDTRASQEEDAQVSQEGNGARADAVFGEPTATGHVRASQENSGSRVEQARKKSGKTTKNRIRVTSLSHIGQSCERCGERYCFDLIRSNNGESFIRCNNCFDLRSLGEVVVADPAFLPAGLRDVFEMDPGSAVVLLREVLKRQTLEEINAVDPMLFSVALRGLFDQDACRYAQLALCEMSDHGSSWAGAIAEYFAQYSSSAGKKYPYCDRPDPMRLVQAFSLMLDAVGDMTPNQAKELLAVFELALDVYARMESNCIDGLRECLSRVTDNAQKNGFELVQLNDIASFLTPFEKAIAEYSEMGSLFEEKLDMFFGEELFRERVELLKKKYSALYPAP